MMFTLSFAYLTSDMFSDKKNTSMFDDACMAIASSSERLSAVLGNATAMVAQTKLLAQAMATLISSIKSDAAKEQSREVGSGIDHSGTAKERRGTSCKRCVDIFTVVYAPMY